MRRTSSADNSRRARPRSISFNAARKSGRLSTRVPSRSNTSAACCIEPACYNNSQNIASIGRTISALHPTSASLFFRFSARSTSSNKRIVAGWSSKIRTRRIGAAPSLSRIGRETITKIRVRFGPNEVRRHVKPSLTCVAHDQNETRRHLFETPAASSCWFSSEISGPFASSVLRDTSRVQRGIFSLVHQPCSQDADDQDEHRIKHNETRPPHL